MSNNPIVLSSEDVTDKRLAALSDEMAQRNATRPGSHIATREAMVLEMIDDLVRKKGPSMELLAIFLAWWAKATEQERIERLAMANFESPVQTS